MGGQARDDDYEYGYDHLHKEEKLTAAGGEDAEGPEEGPNEGAGPEFDYGDDEPEDIGGIESVLAVERIMREINVPPTEPAPEPASADADGRRTIHGKMGAEALRRFEEAAQTKSDFDDVIATWDRLDQNRGRRERYHEVLREEALLDYGQSGEGMIFPQWMMDPTRRQLSKGNFLDYLADCPYEMHDLTAKKYLRQAIAEMWEEHKEIFFFLYLRQYSPQRVAAMRGQTDRNIRKVRDTMLRKVRKKIYYDLKKLQKSGYRMTKREREFLARYEAAEGKIK